jgi:hypothetical protein
MDEQQMSGTVKATFGSVARLSPTDQDTFKREHLEEIAELATEEGIRLDIDVMYTIGSK